MKINPLAHWIDPDVTIRIPADLLNGVVGNELAARALLNRGFTTWDSARKFIDPAAYTPASPYDLPDMAKAVKRLQVALKNEECVGVWGDFDVDGQTATSLLVGVLRNLGAKVEFHIPVREHESHGVNLPGLVRFIERGVNLILTCDTGISAYEAAQYAVDHQIDMIITDHHSLPDNLPPAFAVITPQRLPAAHPSQPLAGVGTAYKLAEALCSAQGVPEIARQQLDLVALGCIADVASLTGDVRYLVQLGLDQLRRPHRVGLEKLYERAELDPARLSEEHIGFIIAPRLNAIGRLSDANPVVDFLTTQDPISAADFAARLEGFNNERRFITEQVFQGAMKMIEREPSYLEEPVLILAHPEWPAGVIGIVASRLVELFSKPVILLSSPPDEPARGSARSIQGVNITSAIAAAADLLKGYGGHPMAAGMSLEPVNLPHFRRRVASAVLSQTENLNLSAILQIDAFIRLPQLTLDTVAGLERLAPFGTGNPPIRLGIKRVRAVDIVTIGRSGEHFQIVIEDEDGNTRRVLWWSGVQDLVPQDWFDLACTARTSNFRGNLEVQLEWVSARVDEQISQTIAEVSPKLRLMDFRTSDDPFSDLTALTTGADFVVWREGHTPGEPKGFPREHLTPAEILIIWDVPPGRQEIMRAVEQVSPKSVAFFAHLVGKDDLSSFLTTLAGLVRHTLRTKAGEVTISQLSGLLNQRESTVHLGLRWLVSKGFIRIDTDEGGNLLLAEPGVPELSQIPGIEKKIELSLDETAGFRAYYLRADLFSLFTVPITEVVKGESK